MDSELELLIDTTLNVPKYHLEERSPDDVKLTGDPMRLSQEKYDVVIIGGGIAGNALATVLARTGRAVLVLERSTVYRDKVRGEVFHARGVAEAQRLGIYETLMRSGGIHPCRFVPQAQLHSESETGGPVCDLSDER